MRKGQRILALDRISIPNGTSSTLSNGPTTFGCSGKVPPVMNLFTQALDRQTATQLLKLAHKYRPATKQKKQKLVGWSEKKDSGKGAVPTKRPGHLSFKQGLIFSPLWWRTRRLSC